MVPFIEEHSLIFGGSGFIGSELVRILNGRKKKVTVVSRYRRNRVSLLNENVLEIPYDRENFREIIKSSSFTSIFILSGNPHPTFSAENPLVDVELSLSPLLALLSVLKEEGFDGSIWYSSSVAVYGSSSAALLSEGQVPQPISPYGIAKLSCENYCSYYADQFGLRVGILRLFSTYGPSLKRQVIYDVFEKMKKNPKSLNLLSLPGDARDFSYVYDVAAAIAQVNDSIIPCGDIINIGSGKATLISDIAKIIAEHLNYTGKITEGASPRRSIDGSVWCADIAKLKNLGFRPKYDIEAGLKDTLASW